MTIFSWKTKEFGNFSPKSNGVFFKVLTTKSKVGRKTSAHLSKLDSALPSGPFVETHVIPKKIQWIILFTFFGGISVFFVVFWDGNRKSVSVPKWMFWGTFLFFLKKARFLSFFQLLGGELSYFANESTTDCKNAFFLSRGAFSRRWFLFWKQI